MPFGINVYILSTITSFRFIRSYTHQKMSEHERYHTDLELIAQKQISRAYALGEHRNRYETPNGPISGTPNTGELSWMHDRDRNL